MSPTEPLANIAQALVQEEYKQVDFTNINPADPSIEGFVTDKSSQGMLRVKVELYNTQGKLLASKITSASGYYAFRFSAPGTYTLKIVVPSGYDCDKPSDTVRIKQFETLRVDLTVHKSS